jgi:hypothetical protein
MPSSWHFLPHVPLLDWRLPAPAALHAPATDATSSVRSSSCMRLNGARHACPMEIAVPEPPATTLLGHLHRSKTPQCCLGWPSQCCMCMCRNSLQHTAASAHPLHRATQARAHTHACNSVVVDTDHTAFRCGEELDSRSEHNTTECNDPAACVPAATLLPLASCTAPGNKR